MKRLQTEDPPDKKRTGATMTGRDIIEKPAIEILNRKQKKEAEFQFWFSVYNEKGEAKRLSNLISMRTTKLTISDLSDLYKEEEQEIIRIFKRKSKNNCLLVGDQIQINDLVTKIQLKMEDTKDYYGIGKYYVFYLDASVFKKSVEKTSVYTLVDAIKVLFADLKVILVINNFDLLIDSRTSQENVNSQVAYKMIELFQAPNFRILATIDEDSYDYTSYEEKAIEDSFYIENIAESRYNQFEKFITPSIKRILPKSSFIDEAGFEKLRTYAGLYEYDNKFKHAYQLIEDAAIIAKEHNRRRITAQDFNDVYADAFRELKTYDKKQVHATAIHEVGHYIVYWCLKKRRYKLHDVVTVTILPIWDGALGFNQSSFEAPIDFDAKYCDAGVLISLGGRAAEDLFCHTLSTGCSTDMQNAVTSVQQGLTYGVFDEEFKYVSMISADMDSVLVLTPEEKSDLHKEITNKINTLYKKVKEILKAHEKEVMALTAALEDQKILSKAEIEQILEPNKKRSKKKAKAKVVRSKKPKPVISEEKQVEDSQTTMQPSEEANSAETTQSEEQKEE